MKSKNLLSQISRDQRGAINPLLIATILLGVLLVAAAGGFIWSYTQMIDYRDNVDDKVAASVKSATEKQQKDDETACQEADKKPNRSYVGPGELGSVRFSYPKTWAAYTAKSDAGSGLAVYFYPNVVPVVKDGDTPYALRVKVEDRTYANTLKNYEGLIKDGKATATTITLTQGSTTYEGTRIDGQLTETINGSVVIFKVRGQVLELFCDSKDYTSDFDNIVLKTLRFEP